MRNAQSRVLTIEESRERCREGAYAYLGYSWVRWTTSLFDLLIPLQELMPSLIYQEGDESTNRMVSLWFLARCFGVLCVGAAGSLLCLVADG